MINKIFGKRVGASEDILRQQERLERMLKGYFAEQDWSGNVWVGISRDANHDFDVVVVDGPFRNRMEAEEFRGHMVEKVRKVIPDCRPKIFMIPTAKAPPMLTPPPKV